MGLLKEYQSSVTRYAHSCPNCTNRGNFGNGNTSLHVRKQWSWSGRRRVQIVCDCGLAGPLVMITAEMDQDNAVSQAQFEWNEVMFYNRQTEQQFRWHA